MINCEIYSDGNCTPMKSALEKHFLMNALSAVGNVQTNAAPLLHA